MLTSEGSILVTGCSSGIGRATAEILRERGFDVIASVRREEDAAELRQRGFKAVLIDNEDDASVVKGFAEALLLSKMNRIVSVFCNAGYGLHSAVEDITPEALRHQLQVNVIATHILMRQACKHMAIHGGGRILVNSSVMGIVAMPLRGAYAASKHCLEGLSWALRLEVADIGISVSLMEPGPVLTRYRANGLKAFNRFVNVSDSRHQGRYRRLLKKLSTEGPVVPFTVTARQCGEVAAKALTTRTPKLHYYVTVQTHVFGMLKRILPASMLDAFLAKG